MSFGGVGSGSLSFSDSSSTASASSSSSDFLNVPSRGHASSVVEETDGVHELPQREVEYPQGYRPLQGRRRVSVSAGKQNKNTACKIINVCVNDATYNNRINLLHNKSLYHKLFLYCILKDDAKVSSSSSSDTIISL